MKQKMEQPAMKSLSHYTTVQACFGATSATSTFVATNTSMVSAVATTSHPNFILVDCIDSEGEAPSTRDNNPCSIYRTSSNENRGL